MTETTIPETFTRADLGELAAGVVELIMQAAPKPNPTAADLDRKAVRQKADELWHLIDDAQSRLANTLARAQALYLACTSDTVKADGNREALTVLASDIEDALEEVFSILDKATSALNPLRALGERSAASEVAA
jgi:hypothetical protein